MEEESRVDNIDLALYLVQTRVRIQDVRRDEVSLEGFFVEEEVVAKLDEARFKICTPEVLGRPAIVDQLADVLVKAAADIKEFLAVLEARNYSGIRW